VDCFKSVAMLSRPLTGILGLEKLGSMLEVAITTMRYLILEMPDLVT
jgi:hypothetical protein